VCDDAQRLMNTLAKINKKINKIRPGHVLVPRADSKFVARHLKVYWTDVPRTRAMVKSVAVVDGEVQLRLAVYITGVLSTRTALPKAYTCTISGYLIYAVFDL